MNYFLATITDQDFTGKPLPSYWHPRHRRITARAVIVDMAGRVAILHSTKYHYHKLPGGGVERGENFRQALERESLEEIGQSITAIKKIGSIREYKKKLSVEQVSHCYLARPRGLAEKRRLTPAEKRQLFKIQWVSFPKALKKFASDRPRSYEGYFMSKRDGLFLKKARQFFSALPK